MKHISHLPSLLALTGLIFLGSSQVAQAQREAPSRSDKRAERQQSNETLSPEQQQANRAARMQERMKSMTPEQRQRMQERMAEFQQKMTDAGIDPNDPEAMQKARNAGLMGNRGGQGGGRGNRASNDAMKQMMEAAGITDFDVQDAIVAYVAEQNKARATLFQLAQTAATALQAPVVQPINAADTGAVSTADAKVATTFGAYETAVKAENDRQTKALKALDAKINYSGTPRIKAFLTLVGILNNDVLAIGGPAAIFAAPQQAGARDAGMDGEGQQQGNWNRGNRNQDQ